MNAVFGFIFIVSLIALCVISPADFLPAMLDGAEKSLTTAATLFCVYALWMGLGNVAEKCSLTKGATKLLKPLSGKLFKTDNPEALEGITLNLSCNLLGIGGAATPYAVRAVNALEKDKNEFAQKLLFIINATSIQILPTTVIALRAAAGSAAASDIFAPSLICTAFSTVFAAGIYILGCRAWRR